jgi:hypothetical protein
MLEHGPEALASEVVTMINTVMERKQVIGLGGDATMYVSTSHPATGSPDRFHGIRLAQYVAFVRAPVPSESKVPGLWFREPGGPPPLDQPFGMLWFGWDVSDSGGAAILQLTWSASDWRAKAKMNIDGGTDVSAATLCRLLHVSEDFLLKTRGRPKGITDHSLQSYERAFRMVAAHTSGRPKIADVAAELDQDRGTVTNNLKRWGYRDYRDFASRMMADN